jgi:glycosyltransferase involved in cell wall biosynthesis
MRIAYIFLPGRIARLAQIDNRELPTDFFYGAIELRKKGYEVDIFEVDERPRRGLIRILSEFLLRKKFSPVKMNPSTLDAVWRLLPELKKYDVVVATTSGIAFSLSFWKIACRLSFSVVGIINGILNYNFNFLRVRLSRLLLKRIAIHLFGEAELDPICLEYGIPSDKITVNNFGVDCSFWHRDQDDSSGGYLLAIGNDSMRDFCLLLEVAKHTEKQVVLVTRREISGDVPANVQIIKGAWHSRELSDLVLREMYRKAFCVVVPLKESYQPSGQSVTLQAMACEKPVILTRTNGLWDQTHLRHNENILFVEPGNIDQIIVCLAELENNAMKSNELGKNARKYVLEHARIEFFAERLEKSIRSFGKVSGKTEVSRF